ncbi:S-adenosyl-l-methionine hydroxide adenosyltransferase family protein [Paraferrimonas sp. SM1919]|uniref:SAM hydrolase/SAM-dependent halogenase family protein n=1 Tax=Paraferrimonas sp. SM1919 TaxID=2662263 RepID=UPI0013D691AD|nr:S-adenosyl-l-methionine hydroxide adenosyltransferase family protein [Paraferrimonas sp. SM1919]
MKKLALAALLVSPFAMAKAPLVFQSDFGVKDGAVSAMKGVSVKVDPTLPIYDLTHEVPTFNTWEASYRLFQTSTYWPEGTVFVSVVDPGVGTKRKSVVLKTKAGYYYVTPDNGTLTLVAETQGIEAVREIDEAVNRLKGSGKSYTFHGRDVYAYTGARLASGVISFEEVGRKLPNEVIAIDYQKATVKNGVIKGNIPVLDPQFGNVWTNIEEGKLAQAGINMGDTVCVTINNGDKKVLDTKFPYVASFGEVPMASELVYSNSLLNVSFALNQANFAAKHGIASGAAWNVSLKQCN